MRRETLEERREDIAAAVRAIAAGHGGGAGATGSDGREIAEAAEADEELVRAQVEAIAPAMTPPLGLDAKPSRAGRASRPSSGSSRAARPGPRVRVRSPLYSPLMRRDYGRRHGHTSSYRNTSGSHLSSVIACGDDASQQSEARPGRFHDRDRQPVLADGARQPLGLPRDRQRGRGPEGRRHGHRPDEEDRQRGRGARRARRRHRARRVGRGHRRLVRPGRRTGTSGTWARTRPSTRTGSRSRLRVVRGRRRRRRGRGSSCPRIPSPA